jgi:hypothetical protein
MRLFWQLSETEQHNAIHYCSHLVLDDVLSGSMKIEAVNEDDNKLQEALTSTYEIFKTLTTDEEKVDIVMENELLSQAVYEIAGEMARTAFYHDQEKELIIFDADIKFDDINVDVDIEEVIDLVPLKSKKDPSHSLN